MPKSSNHLALARQWEMLKLLPGRAPGVSARELTSQLKEGGYEVSKRTVERDLNDLTLQFGIVCNDQSMPYGWHWLPGQKPAFGSMELVDAVSLSLAEDLLVQMLPPSMLQVLQPKFEQARSKLAALSEQPLARLSSKVRYVSPSFSFCPPTIRPKLLECLQQALVREKQIDVSYAAFRKDAKDLRLHPLALVQRGNVPYLAATAFEYSDVRLYPIHRFENVEALEDGICIPEGFDLDAYLSSGAMDFGGGEVISFKAKVSESLATYLAETPMSEDQKLSYQDASWMVEAGVTDSWQFRFWILSQGARLEVSSPEELRACIASSAERVKSHYY